jgi:hypothetical protein
MFSPKSGPYSSVAGSASGLSISNLETIAKIDGCEFIEFDDGALFADRAA